MRRESSNRDNQEISWINPIGGLGDQLMISGVLKQVVDNYPSKQYNLIRRTNYLSILKGHPAIAGVGFPPKDSKTIGTDYWSIEELGPGDKRPYQVLAREFGLKKPVEEKMYLPDGIDEDPLLNDFLPWKERNILIAPASDSPRKVAHPSIWHRLVDFLLADDFFVVQAGRTKDIHIRNAYSLLGLTTPRQLIGLLSKFDLIVTSDSFIMHAAHLTGTRAVVIWGPTNHEIYGYPEHIHIQMAKNCDLNPYEDCIGPTRNEGGKLYGTPCPLRERHCVDQIKPEVIYDAIKKALMNF